MVSVVQRGARNYPPIPPPGVGVTEVQNVSPAGLVSLRTIIGVAPITAVVNGDTVEIGTSAAALTRFEWSPAETNGQQDNRRVRNIGSTGNFDFGFDVPADFDSLLSLVLVGASRTADTDPADMTLDSVYGAVGENRSEHTESAAIQVALVSGVIVNIDLTPAFAAVPLTAGDSASVELTHGGISGSVDYYGIRQTYLVAP